MLLRELSVLLCLVVCSESALPVLGSFEVKYPGFITLANNNSDKSNPTFNILISRFNGFPFSTDYVSLVRDIGNPTSMADSRVEQVTNSVHWPNEPGAIPEKVFNRKNMVVIPSGFLVPTKTQGALTVFDLNEASMTPYQLTSSDDGDWFYHRAIWLDMDGDGKDDLVTCRAQKPIFGDEKGQMLWLKQPDGNMPWNQKWKETILAEGLPDTFLIPVQIKDAKGNNIQTVITAGFFSESLDIWWRKDESSSWSSQNLERRQLDGGEGNTFDLLHTDLNSDGMAELLVTYNKASNGTVFVYESAQGDLRSAQLNKHLIMSGLDPAKSGTGKGAPGGIKLTWPDLRKTAGRPDIILSGDDNGKLYLLRANSSTGWTYESRVLLDASPGTMGAVAVGDINNDNYPEIIAPAYNDNKVTILSYNPKTERVTGPTDRAHGMSWLQQLHHWFGSLLN